MEVILKKFISYLSFFPFLIFIGTPYSVCAQSYQGQYMHISYLNISPESEEAFHQKISDILLPVQQVRIDKGDITSWQLYSVAYPGTQNSPYNYVIITTGGSIAAFEDVIDSVSDDLTNNNQQQILQSYQNSLNPNHKELWSIRNSVMKSEEVRPSRYMVINYMRVGQGYEFEYQMMEDEVARPLHIRRMDKGVMEGWELHEMILPGGAEYGYNFSTVDYYDKLEHVEFGFTEELIRQTHPDTDINEFFDNINRSRDLVRREVWELVESL